MKFHKIWRCFFMAFALIVSLPAPSSAGSNTLLIHKCDVYASAPFDDRRIARAVSDKDLVESLSQSIVDVCREAVRDYPKINRFKIQLARVLLVDWLKFREYETEISSLLTSATKGEYPAAYYLTHKFQSWNPSTEKMSRDKLMENMEKFLKTSQEHYNAHSIIGFMERRRLDRYVGEKSSDAWKKRRDVIISHFMRGVEEGNIGALRDLALFYIRDDVDKQRGEILLNIAAALGDTSSKTQIATFITRKHSSELTNSNLMRAYYYIHSVEQENSNFMSKMLKDKLMFGNRYELVKKTKQIYQDLNSADSLKKDMILEGFQIENFQAQP